jgi:hypothetical protein
MHRDKNNKKIIQRDYYLVICCDAKRYNNKNALQRDKF